MKKMKKRLISARIITLSFLLCSATASANNDVKEAFNAGIKNAIKVYKHEKEQAFKPIPNGYCISVRNTEGQLDDFSEIKLETLGLIMGYKPSLLLLKDKNNKKILCLTIVTSTKKAEKTLETIRNKYPKIELYFPKIALLGDVSSYKRIVPAIGELKKDNTDVIDTLSERIAFLKSELRKAKKQDFNSSSNKNELKISFRKKQEPEIKDEKNSNTFFKDDIKIRVDKKNPKIMIIEDS